MRELTLTNSQLVTIVDDDDFERVSQYRWQIDTMGAVRRGISINGVKMDVYLHRVINQTPEGRITDHINHNKLDNRKANLRTATNSENLGNQVRKLGKKSSRFKGVAWTKYWERWVAYITKDGRRWWLGRYKIEEDAARAYNMKAIELFGPFARLNIIP